MVSELAGEGAMPLPTPASRRLEIAHHPRAVEEKPIEDVLSFPILLSDQIKDAIKEDDSFRLECSDDEEDRHNLIGDSEQRNSARSPGRSSFAIDGSKNRFVNPARFNFSCRKRFFPSIASNSSRSRSVKIASRVLVNPLFTVFNSSSRSRSVRSSAELVTPLFDLVSLSKVLVISLFTVFIRSRSAEILSAELVAVASSPQRRTRKKKQLLTQIRDSGSRSMEFVNQPSVIDSACVGRSLAIQNSAMVCRLPYVNLFFAYVSRSRRGEQLVFASDSACGYCNLVLSEQQIEAEPVKEEPENPPANSIKLKKTKEPKAKKSSAPKKRNSPAHPPYFEKVQEAFVTLKERTGSSQYAIQKFTAKKQRSNSRNLLPFHLKKFVAVDKLVKTGGNLAGVVTARIESSTLSFAAEVKKGKVGKDAPINPRLPTDIIIIMYSNGSTRLPKGDMITNGNIVATSAATMSLIPNRGTNDVYVAYLLLTHIFELAVETVMKSELVFDGNLHLSEADKRGAVAVVASKEIGIEESLHESPKDAADFSLIPEAVDDYQFGDSNEKFVFPFLPSSDKGGLPDLSFVSSGIASDIYSAGISSTYQCQNSEAKIPVETEMAIKHLRQVRNQVMNSTDVDLQSKRLMDAVIDVSAEVLWFTRKEEMLRLPMLKKCLLFLLLKFLNKIKANQLSASFSHFHSKLHIQKICMSSLPGGVGGRI